MRITPFIRQNKLIDGVVINFINVSEIKKLNSILEAVFNSSTSGIIAKKAIRDENNKIVTFEFIAINAAAENMLGKQAVEIIGTRMHDSYTHLEQEYTDAYIEVVEKGSVGKFEFFNEEVNRWFDVVCVKIMDGLVSTFTDITGIKQSADQLKKGYDVLEATTQQLKTTNQELEKSNLDHTIFYRTNRILTHPICPIVYQLVGAQFFTITFMKYVFLFVGFP